MTISPTSPQAQDPPTTTPDYESLYIELLESLAEVGLSLQIQSRNAINQYKKNKKALQEQHQPKDPLV